MAPDHRGHRLISTIACSQPRDMTSGEKSGLGSGVSVTSSKTRCDRIKTRRYSSTRVREMDFWPALAAQTKILSLGVLRSLSCLMTTVFLTFHSAGVTSDKTGLFEGRAKF